METETGKKRKNTVRAMIAWTGTILILVYLFFTTDIHAVANAFKNADLVLFLIVAFSSVAVTYVTDVFTVRFLLGRVGINVGFLEFARIKGASYLLNIVNYNLALVMMAAVVKKRSSKGWGAAGSPFILLNFIDLSVFSGIVQVAILSGKSPFDRVPTMILGGLTLAGLLGGPVLWLVSRWTSAPGLLGRIIRNDILAAFRYLTPLSLAAVTSMRLVLILEYGLMNLMFMRSFGIVMPWLDQLFIMAITSFIAMIPISISGIGSTQYVMRDLCKPYVPDSVATGAVQKMAVIDAMTTAGIFGVLIIRVVLGLFCMRSVSRYVVDDTEPIMKKLTGDARTDAAIIIDATIRHGDRSTDLINAAAPLYPDQRDFGLLRELVGGVLRRRMALEMVIGPHLARGLEQTRPILREILLCHAYQLLFLDRVPAHARVSGAVDAARRTDGESGARFVNAVARSVERAVDEAPTPLLETLPPEVLFSIPPAIMAQIVAATGDDGGMPDLERLAMPAPVAVRVSRDADRRREALEALAACGTEPTPGTWSRDCLILDSGRILGTKAVPGLLLPQDEASQMVVAALAPVDGRRILDLCCGTGVKTSQILDIAPGADVLGIDTDTRKLDRCKELCRIAGRGKPRVMGADATALPDEMNGQFDMILLDAPCTGVGTLRRRPEVRYTREADDFTKSATLQEALLERAVRLLAPGGRLVYAVCSFAPAEGRDVVGRVLARHPELKIVPTGLDASLASADGTVTTLPWIHDMDGFFIAAIGAR